jgi:hypothetical protein
MYIPFFACVNENVLKRRQVNRKSTGGAVPPRQAPLSLRSAFCFNIEKLNSALETPHGDPARSRFDMRISCVASRLMACHVQNGAILEGAVPACPMETPVGNAASVLRRSHSGRSNEGVVRDQRSQL